MLPSEKECINWIKKNTWEVYPESVGKDLYKWLSDRQKAIDEKLKDYHRKVV